MNMWVRFIVAFGAVCSGNHSFAATYKPDDITASIFISKVDLAASEDGIDVSGGAIAKKEVRLIFTAPYPDRKTFFKVDQTVKVGDTVVKFDITDQLLIQDEPEGLSTHRSLRIFVNGKMVFENFNHQKLVSMDRRDPSWVQKNYGQLFVIGRPMKGEGGILVLPEIEIIFFPVE